MFFYYLIVFAMVRVICHHLRIYVSRIKLRYIDQTWRPCFSCYLWPYFAIHLYHTVQEFAPLAVLWIVDRYFCSTHNTSRFLLRVSFKVRVCRSICFHTLTVWVRHALCTHRLRHWMPGNKEKHCGGWEKSVCYLLKSLLHSHWLLCPCKELNVILADRSSVYNYTHTRRASVSSRVHAWQRVGRDESWNDWA